MQPVTISQGQGGAFAQKALEGIADFLGGREARKKVYKARYRMEKHK